MLSAGGKGVLMRSVSVVLLGSLGVSASACSDENAPVDAVSGGSNTAGASSAGESGGGASGASGNSSAGSLSADKTGSVIVSGQAFRSVGTLAVHFTLSGDPAPCEHINYDDCVLSDTSCADNDTSTTYASAGTVSLTSASPQLDIDIDPDSTGVYPATELKAGLVGGEMLHIAATGAAVPAFSSDLKVPPLLVVDQPVADSSGLIKVPTTQDLVLSFSRGRDGVSLVLLGGSNTKTLSCSGLSSSSTLIVKAAALAAVGSGAQLKAFTVGVDNAPVNGWAVKVGTAAEAITPDHKAAITVQVQ